VDEVLLYLNPSFLGDSAQGILDLPAPDSLEGRTKLRVLSLERLGEDFRILARTD
jgi:diaminohydroxyphosphoribosylaminopyrimidine deaminase/5-amino-6-(5-phosphoribosylamino)uracil reductase